MSEHHEQKAGKWMVSNWLEERAVAHIDTAETQNQTHKYGHRGLLSMELGAKMEDVTTVRATYVQHQGPGVRLKGRRLELLERQIAQSARQKMEHQMKPAPCEPEYRSVSEESFSVPGFVPLRERITPVHDYRSQDAITFWSENHQKIQKLLDWGKAKLEKMCSVQGLTPVPSASAPFRKCSGFSRPIGERLDEVDPPLED